MYKEDEHECMIMVQRFQCFPFPFWAIDKLGPFNPFMGIASHSLKTRRSFICLHPLPVFTGTMPTFCTVFALPQSRCIPRVQHRRNLLTDSLFHKALWPKNPIMLPWVSGNNDRGSSPVSAGSRICDAWRERRQLLREVRIRKSLCFDLRCGKLARSHA